MGCRLKIVSSHMKKAIDTDLLQDTWTPMTTHRASRCVSFVLGLALGTGVAVLLSLLSTWFSP